MSTRLLAAGGGGNIAEEAMSHVAQHILPGAQIGQGLLSFPLMSNHILMQLVAAALLVWGLPRLVRMRAGQDDVGRLTPRGFGTVIELICTALRDHVGKPNLGAYTDRFMPFLWSVFFFILTCNLLGMLPLTPLADLIFGKYHAHQIGGTSTGNVFVTGALAVLTLVMVVYNGLRFHGMAYVKHFFMGPVYLAWFIALLEMAGLAFKTVALTMRLFANMIAGHIVLAALLTFISMGFALGGALGVAAGTGVGILVILGSVLFNFLELLVSFIQAFVFTLLTAVFLGQAVNIHHDEEHAHEHGHEHSAAGAHA